MLPAWAVTTLAANTQLVKGFDRIVLIRKAGKTVDVAGMTGKTVIVDTSFKDIMKSLVVNGNAMRAMSFAGRLQKFRGHNAALDKIQKSLEEYLETKRQAFPRFYFLSNDELLEIWLAEGNDSLEGVLHCYTGSLGFARRALEHGRTHAGEKQRAVRGA